MNHRDRAGVRAAIEVSADMNATKAMEEVAGWTMSPEGRAAINAVAAGAGPMLRELLERLPEGMAAGPARTAFLLAVVIERCETLLGHAIHEAIESSHRERGKVRPACLTVIEHQVYEISPQYVEAMNTRYAVQRLLDSLRGFADSRRTLGERLVFESRNPEEVTAYLHAKNEEATADGARSHAIHYVVPGPNPEEN